MRTLLTTATTFYLDPAGNDGHAGTSAGTAWQTLQGAYDNLRTGYDLGGVAGHSLQLANGEYTNGVNWCGPLVGQFGNFKIHGSANPENIIIRAHAGNCFAVSQGGNIAIDGMHLDSAIADQDNTCVGVGGILYLQNVAFGFTGSNGCHMDASEGGTYVITGNYSIRGSGGQAHMTAGTGGRIVFETNGASGICAVEVLGTNAFSAAFACASYQGQIQMLTVGLTMAPGASVNAVRYMVKSGGVIDTETSNANYFPGTAAGTNDGTGRYT